MNKITLLDFCKLIHPEIFIPSWYHEHLVHLLEREEKQMAEEKKEIHYKEFEGKLITPCPYNKVAAFTVNKKVGSVHCTECGFNIDTDHTARIVKCKLKR